MRIRTHTNTHTHTNTLKRILAFIFLLKEEKIELCRHKKEKERSEKCYVLALKVEGHKLKNVGVSLILFVIPIVLLFSLFTQFTEPRVGKA